MDHEGVLLAVSSKSENGDAVDDGKIYVYRLLSDHWTVVRTVSGLKRADRVGIDVDMTGDRLVAVPEKADYVLTRTTPYVTNKVF